MKTIFLTVALLLLILFGFEIAFNFLAIAFNYQDLLLYAGVGLVIYLMIRGVGSSLNKKFDKSINDFLSGRKNELFDDKKLLRTFGFLLIVLLPFLLYLLALALFAAIDFGLYGLIGVLYLPRIPIAILIGLGVVVIGTAIAVLIGIYHLFFPPRRKILGLEINKNEERKLWDITQIISKELQAKPIDKIVITPDSGVGVYLEGNLFQTIFGGGKRVLEVSLSSLHDLTIDEFKAILAHEYGHFSNRDTQWSSFTYTMGNSLLRTLESTPGPAKVKTGETNLAQIIVSLNPAYWFLLVYVKLYFKITAEFSRIREVMADKRAIELYGGEAFSRGLMKIATNDVIFNEIIQNDWVPKFLKEEKTISNFSKFMDLVYENVNENTINELKSEILSKSQTQSVFDSHPSLKTRVDYASRLNRGEEKDREKIDKLFDNWGDVNKKVADLYNLRLIYLLQKINQHQTPSGKQEMQTEGGKS